MAASTPSRFAPDSYALASGLRGFSSSSLRVRIVKVLPDETVAVRTADLRDAGTLLCLDPAQLTPEVEMSAGVQHRDGFVVFTEGA